MKIQKKVCPPHLNSSIFLTDVQPYTKTTGILALTYKNYKNFCIKAIKKSLCDTYDGTGKRLTAGVEAYKRLICKKKRNIFKDGYLGCTVNIPGIQFIHISTKRIQETHAVLTDKFTIGRSHHVRTRQYQCYSYKCKAEVNAIPGSFNINAEIDINGLTKEGICLNVYVSCTYEKWWVGVVVEVSDLEQEVKINFLHLPIKFRWPRRPDVCWVP